MRIDGKQLASSLFEKLARDVKRLKENNITPHLVVLLVGNDPASEAYVRQKKLKGEAIGIHVSIHHYKEDIPESELLQAIHRLNTDKNVHGIIVQQPLPSQIDAKKIVHATSPTKDVDGFHPDSMFTPPIAEAVMEILDFIRLNLDRGCQGSTLKDWLKSKEIIIIGKGETGGTPIIQKMNSLGVEAIIVDSKTANSDEITKKADIIISCVGRSRIVKAEAIKKGVILLSIGIFRGEDGKLHGDYVEEEIKDIAIFYTPVPGGVGPVNVAMLLKNVVIAATKKR